MCVYYIYIHIYTHAYIRTSLAAGMYSIQTGHFDLMFTILAPCLERPAFKSRSVVQTMFFILASCRIVVK